MTDQFYVTMKFYKWRFYVFIQVSDKYMIGNWAMSRFFQKAVNFWVILVFLFLILQFAVSMFRPIKLAFLSPFHLSLDTWLGRYYSMPLEFLFLYLLEICMYHWFCIFSSVWFLINSSLNKYGSIHFWTIRRMSLSSFLYLKTI